MGAYPMKLLLTGLGIVTPGRRGNERASQPSAAPGNARQLSAKKNRQSAYQWTHFFGLYVYTVIRSGITSQLELALH